MLLVVVLLRSLRSPTPCFRLMFTCPVYLTLRRSISMRRPRAKFLSLALMSVMLSLTFVMVGWSSTATLVKVVVKTFLRFLMQ
ncbi:hypothetical protein ALO50_200059 [Pseudomonas syringae pv. cerasicola]|uniref:Uncharacterized protein n=1 Tax=Pseudomonas syringae pv. cerasicola TaxID=264451 RepID=A0A0P9RZ16_PSESX|nr:hypothetical protein ALO50_200059 [Pseudomonas syringae pv. cerasicola]